jgi:HD-GYP domain-containing protein (c-di-GMP phosphodiesterase class II)
LTEEEFDEMRRHPTIGADILASLDFVREAVPIILFHHERFGGGGYPSGVAGETIPLGARIIAVADSFDAMTSNRPYRDGMPYAKAIAELKRCTGTQFDPDVVAAFLKVIEDEGLGDSQSRRDNDLPTHMATAVAANAEWSG